MTDESREVGWKLFMECLGYLRSLDFVPQEMGGTGGQHLPISLA